ncbi:MAG: hypothetical protein GEU79_08955 [Acidimicrobiia bacterium]|nr:hypothetical protein [Acidimicrobiia bacterium]
MFERLWWFVSGIVAGGVVTVRALRRRPRPDDLKHAIYHTSADLMGLASRVVAPRDRVLDR